MVTAWVAVRNLPRGGTGLVLDWQQRFGRLAVSGHTDTIRLWDVEKMVCMRDLPLSTESLCYSLTSSGDGAFVYAACGDGTVRMFDSRIEKSFVSFSTKHQGRCVKVHLQRIGGDIGKLVSGSATGEVIVSDLRMTAASLAKFTAIGNKMSLDALAVHDFAPVLAAGSANQLINIYDLNGTLLKTVKHHKGFMGNRVGPVSSLAFHPIQQCLAASGSNSFISILSAVPHAANQP